MEKKGFCQAEYDLLSYSTRCRIQFYTVTGMAASLGLGVLIGEYLI